MARAECIQTVSVTAGAAVSLYRFLQIQSDGKFDQVGSAQARADGVSAEATVDGDGDQIAMALMGKDRPTWTPSELSGAHVVVVHSRAVRTTGHKASTKVYPHYTRYAGGLKEVPMADVLERRPNDVVTLAVRRMLPKTRLGHRMLKRLKVYPGAEHPHAAQKPTVVEPS